MQTHIFFSAEAKSSLGFISALQVGYEGRIFQGVMPPVFTVKVKNRWGFSVVPRSRHQCDAIEMGLRLADLPGLPR